MFFSKEHERNCAQFYLCSLISKPCFSPEDRLILICARTWATPAEIKEVLKPNLDWEYIMEVALQNRIAPILFHNLEKRSNGIVPPGVMESLRIKYFAAVRHNALALSELSEILRVLLDAQIKAIALKGVALSETVYRDTVPRPFGDIDLLISKEDKHKTVAKLSQLGYELSEKWHERFAEQFDVALSYTRADRLPIDLHWCLIQLPYSKHLDMDLLWGSAVPLDMDGVDALALSPEDLLIHLCLHVSKAGYAHLLWLVDISEDIHYYSETVDWELFLEKVERYRIHYLAHNVLDLVDKLFDPSIPKFVLEQLCSQRSLSFEARLFSALSKPNITRLRKMGIVGFLKIHGTESKTKHLFGELFPDRDFMMERYPGRSICTSYCLRIWSALRGLMGFIAESFRASMQRRA